MSARHSTADRAADSGFTLIEVVIALGIMAILTWAVGSALGIGLKTANAASDQVDRAAWGQIAGSWFLSDVQRAEIVGAETCSVPPGDMVGSFSWTTNPGAPNPRMRHAVWWLGDADTGYNLARRECESGPTKNLVVARGVFDARIDCEASPNEIAPNDVSQCTIAWVTESGISPGAWPYRMTASRRPA